MHTSACCSRALTQRGACFTGAPVEKCRRTPLATGQLGHGEATAALDAKEDLQGQFASKQRSCAGIAHVQVKASSPRRPCKTLGRLGPTGVS